MQQPPSSVNSQQAWKMIHDGLRMRSRCSRPVRAEQSLGVLQRLRQHRSQKNESQGAADGGTGYGWFGGANLLYPAA